MAKITHEIDLARVRANLAESIRAAREENVTLIVSDSDTGKAWRISPDGTIERHDVGPDQTDWARVRTLTDAEIEAVDTTDEGLADDWTDDAIIVRGHDKEIQQPSKTA